jgi:hypothetical protein
MKNKTLIVPFLAFLGFIAFIAGCSKSSSSSNTGKPDADSLLITSAAWKFSSSGYNLSGGGTISIVDTTVTACQKDNTYTFLADSAGTMDEGATKCNVGDPQTQPFSWYFMNKDAMLHITSNTILNGDLNVFSLSASSMVIYKDTSLLGAPIRYIVQFTH